MSGYITGGWEFVIAAYTFTGTALSAYLISLVLRLRAETRARRAAEEAAQAEAARLPEGSLAEAVS